MDKMKIKDRVIKNELINWRELKFIQNEDFKELPVNERERLKASFKLNGFVDPFMVWQDAKGVTWCLDGKHRTLLLEELCSDGVEVPSLLPANFMRCSSKKDAAKLVLIYSSVYAHITQDGMHNFIQQNSIDFVEIKDYINLPEFSEERFEQKFDLFNVNDVIEDAPIEIDPKDIIVSQGDIFSINGHRIACGCFSDVELVKSLMDGEKARIVNCDPPYNIPISLYKVDGKRHKDFAMGIGEMDDQSFVEFLSSIMTVSVNNTLPGAIHYIFMDWRHVWHMTEASRNVYGSVQPKQLCVWNKERMANGSFYRSKHELCFIFKSGKAKHLSHLVLKDRIRTNVWDYPGANSAGSIDKIDLSEHPTPKSVQMIADSILDTTNPKDLVVDWFLGSGTSLIACEHTDRNGRFVELEEAHVQSSIIRYLNYCSKRNIEVNFTHINGKLTLNDFANEQSKLQPRE